MIQGRPGDTKIEKTFMAKLRGPKLQVINAESELEMCLAEEEKKAKNQDLQNIDA